jgi:hypothetical protein
MRLAYVAAQDNVDRLYLRAMDGQDARAIPGTEGATNPSFSPDGQWLGFSAGGKLKKISLDGRTRKKALGWFVPRRP